MGKLNGEKTETQNRIPCVNVTLSGIWVKAILWRLISQASKRGRERGPAISNLAEMEYMLKKNLQVLWEEYQTLFPPDIKTMEDIASSYHCFRSLRQASDTRALEMNVLKTDVDCVNRWGRDQRNTHGITLKLPMRQHYAEPELLVNPFLRHKCNVTRPYILCRIAQTSRKRMKIDDTASAGGVD